MKPGWPDEPRKLVAGVDGQLGESICRERIPTYKEKQYTLFNILMKDYLISNEDPAPRHLNLPGCPSNQPRW